MLAPLLIATGDSIPVLCVEGVPGLPAAPQDDAGLTRKFDSPLTLPGRPAGREGAGRPGGLSAATPSPPTTDIVSDSSQEQCGGKLSPDSLGFSVCRSSQLN